MTTTKEEIKIGVLIDEDEAINFKVNIALNKLSLKKVLEKFIVEFNQNPEHWIEILKL